MQEMTTLPAIHLGENTDSLRKDFKSFKYLATRIFGCWHLQMTRPITRNNETYRACLRCGLRRPFDLSIWKSYGSFYAATSNGRPRG
jgi:hypothetical protein